MGYGEFKVLAEKTLQKIFEFYCSGFQCNTINLMSFYKDGNLELKNYFLNEAIVRAIACTIPVTSLVFLMVV